MFSNIISIYIIYTHKRKKFKVLHTILTVIIWFCGFGCKGYGLLYLDFHDDKNIPVGIIIFFMIVIRTLALFFYIPILGHLK